MPRGGLLAGHMAKSGMEASFYECRATIIRLFRRYIIYGKKKLVRILPNYGPKNIICQFSVCLIKMNLEHGKKC